MKPTKKIKKGVEVRAEIMLNIWIYDERRHLIAVFVAMEQTRSLAAHGTMLLSATSDDVIATTLANELALSVDAVSLDSETLVAQTGGVSSVSVHFSVIAQASDFPGTTFTGDESAAVYAKIAGALNVSVSSGSFKSALVTEATAQGAPQLMSLANVTYAGASFAELSATTDDEVSKDPSSSEGRFYGLVIGVPVAVFVVLLLVALFVGHGLKHIAPLWQLLRYLIPLRRWQRKFHLERITQFSRLSPQMGFS